jgi:hypothetical protein
VLNTAEDNGQRDLFLPLLGLFVDRVQHYLKG